MSLRCSSTTSGSPLRCRDDVTVRASLELAGFADVEVRERPYAPGRGWLIVARC